MLDAMSVNSGSEVGRHDDVPLLSTARHARLIAVGYPQMLNQGSEMTRSASGEHLISTS